MQFIVYPGRAAIFDNIGKRSYWRGFQSKSVLLKKRFPISAEINLLTRFQDESGREKQQVDK